MSFLPEYLKSDAKSGAMFAVDKACRPNGAGFKAMTSEEIARELPGAKVDLAKFRVYKAEFANTLIDRHRDKFNIAVLQKFADRANTGKVKLLFNHDSNKPIGKVLGASVQGQSLVGYIAVHTKFTMPGQAVTVAEAMDDEIIEDVSVGFGGVKYVALEMSESGMPNAWAIEDDTASPTGAELRELSIVVQGAQIGAGIVKSIDGNKEKEKSTTMSYNHTFTVGQKSITVTGKMEDGTVKVDGLQDLIKAANDASAEAEKERGEKTALKTELDALKASNTEARKPFEADILNLQKAAGIPESALYTDESLKAMPFDKLVSLSREIREKADQSAGEKGATATVNTPKHLYA